MDACKGASRLVDLLLKEQFPVEDRERTGFIKVERVLGKSVATSVFSRYPLKFMIPKRVAPSGSDVILVFSITYGGGIVSGDSTFSEIHVGASCTVVLSTQASTNVYKSVEGKTSTQKLKCHVGRGAFLAILPDFITCFATAKYCQLQVFDLAPDANIVLVDWLSSGRHAQDEIWSFDSFKSTNHIYINGNTPVLLDSVCLDQGSSTSVAERMGAFRVIVMIVIYGPQLASLCKGMQESVNVLASKAFNRRFPSVSSRGNSSYPQQQTLSKSMMIGSCSSLGLLGEGLVVRLAALNTAVVYEFLKEHLRPVLSFTGIKPYAQR